MIGQICFGILFEDNELPWDEEPWCGDHEQWWKDVNGYKNPLFCPYTDDGYYKHGIKQGDPAIDAYLDHKIDWEKANPFPINLLICCSYDDPVWILAEPSSVMTNYDVYPEKFDPTSLVCDGAGVLAFCKQWRIPVSKPQWWLSSYGER